jgi:hypothetical protein
LGLEDDSALGFGRLSLLESAAAKEMNWASENGA